MTMLQGRNRVSRQGHSPKDTNVSTSLTLLDKCEVWFCIFNRYRNFYVTMMGNISNSIFLIVEFVICYRWMCFSWSLTVKQWPLDTDTSANFATLSPSVPPQSQGLCCNSHSCRPCMISIGTNRTFIVLSV